MNNDNHMLFCDYFVFCFNFVLIFMCQSNNVTYQSQYFIFNLVLVFVVLVQFSHNFFSKWNNFVPLEIETKFNFYIKV